MSVEGGNLELQFQSIKDNAGTLDRSFVLAISRCFGLANFVETGTFLGQTVAAFLDDFDKLVSIELSPDLFLRASRRFSAHSKVELINGDSAECLGTVLGRLGGASALIWLDAHFSGDNTAKGNGNTPVLDELESIRAYGSGREVILIDDLRLFWNVPAGFKEHESIAGYPSITDLMALMGKDDYDFFALIDALLVVPRDVRSLYAPTPVLTACTRSRVSGQEEELARSLEGAIVSARGAERRTLREISDYLLQQSQYGLGGHYFYWRGLVRENEGDDEGAGQDFALASKAGVTVPAHRRRQERRFE
jgi:hypothetical protein